MTNQTLPLSAIIARTAVAARNCETANNLEWRDKWSDRMDSIDKNLLPSGSGIDSGSTIDRDKTTSNKIVINTSYHHMNEAGYYVGWTEHTITIRSEFDGLGDIRVSGRNQNDVKEYLADIFHDCLSGKHADTLVGMEL